MLDCKSLIELTNREIFKLQWTALAISRKACKLVLRGEKQWAVVGRCYLSIFRFENYWPLMSGFKEVVQNAWNAPVNEVDPTRILAAKFLKTGKALRAWSRLKIGDIKLQLNMALKIVYLLDCAQETRQLSQQELNFRKELKLKILGLQLWSA